jgi:Glyoxalase-like domain
MTIRGVACFIKVPEPMQVKNRILFDLRPVDGTRNEGVTQLLALGASRVADRRLPNGAGWMLLAHPDGNELCILRGESEVGTGSGLSKRSIYHCFDGHLGHRTGRQPAEALAVGWRRANHLSIGGHHFLSQLAATQPEG